MERQIFISHKKNDLDTVIKDLLKYFKVISFPNLPIFYEFGVKNLSDEYLKQFRNLKKSKLKISWKENVKKPNRSHFKVELAISFDDMEAFLKIFLKDDMSVSVNCNNILVSINDNDGDFMIINSKHELYRRLKKLHKE